MPTCPSSCLALRRDAVSECYHDLQMLIYKVTHNFAHRHNVPFDELLGEAHLSFMRAYDNYRPDKFKKKARFSSFVYFALSCDLSTYLKKRHRHDNHLEIDEELCGVEVPSDFRLRLEGGLEHDARTVVRLVLDAPEELSALMHDHCVHSKRGVVQALKQHLIETGWTLDQITIAFDEIRQSLTKH